jgi:hypothetical protein
VHEITASDADVVRALLEYDGIRHACAAWGRTEDSEVREPEFWISERALPAHKDRRMVAV